AVMDGAQLQTDRAELQAIADRFIAALKRRDVKAMGELYALNGVAESPMYATRVGRQSIEDAYRSFVTSFPDFSVDVESFLVDPPHLAFFATINATHVNE